ncbi:MAG: RnfABCDGE type electron transport complex subunit G [Deltaproteobacteria bacterium]|nr:RnfABCDGE type electron transport complex subunit G [Deltaproteobacteria bacterium]
MRDMLKLFLSVVVFSAVSGGLLGGLKGATQERIEYQQLVNVKGPAIREILEGASNDPLTDRFKIKDGEVERNFFMGVFDGKPNTVVVESSGKGYGGNIGVVVALNLESDQIVGVSLTTHSETPGLGARAKTDPSFVRQFKGLPVKEPPKVKAEGGKVDAISGATTTSRGVCGAVGEALEIYGRLKGEIVQKAKTIKKA